MVDRRRIARAKKKPPGRSWRLEPLLDAKHLSLRRPPAAKRRKVGKAESAQKLPASRAYARKLPVGMDICHRASHTFTICDQTLSVNVNFGAFNTHACIRISVIDADQPGRGRDCLLNYFGVDASQLLSVWRERGWIHPDDPRGWLQWFAATTWAGAWRRRTSAKSSAGGRRADISGKPSCIANLATSSAVRGSGRRFCTGRMTVGKFESKVDYVVGGFA
jgi:hypothetical protein